MNFLMSVFDYVLNELRFGESGVKIMYLSIGMSEKECENWYYFCSLVLISELRDLNVRNIVLDNIFVFASNHINKN